MNNKVQLTIDGETIEANKGQSILEAATGAGVYVPHLCEEARKALGGCCHICTVAVNGEQVASCNTKVEDGMNIICDNDEKLNELRKEKVIEIYNDNNHYCYPCENSGKCELQAVAFRLGVLDQLMVGDDIEKALSN